MAGLGPFLSDDICLPGSKGLIILIVNKASEENSKLAVGAAYANALG